MAAKSLSRYRGLLPTAEKTSLEVRLMMQLSVWRGWRSLSAGLRSICGVAFMCAVGSRVRKPKIGRLQSDDAAGLLTALRGAAPSSHGACFRAECVDLRGRLMLDCTCPLG